MSLDRVRTQVLEPGFVAKVISNRRAQNITRILERAHFRSWQEKFLLGKKDKKISIVMYHSVAAGIEPFSVSPDSFGRQIRFIAENYEVVRLSDLNSLLRENHDESRKVVVTFDDAYSHLLGAAYSVLQKYAVPCTIFVPTRFIGGTNEWDLAGNGIATKRLMSADDLSRLVRDGLVDLGSHTVDHVSMRGLSRHEMEAQLVQSKRTLEDLIAKEVNSFAYPFGQLRNFSRESTEAVQKAGYSLAVTTRWGTVNRYENRFALRRIFFDESDSHEQLRQKLEGAYDWFAAKERLSHAAFLIGERFKR